MSNFTYTNRFAVKCIYCGKVQQMLDPKHEHSDYKDEAEYYKKLAQHYFDELETYKKAFFIRSE